MSHRVLQVVASLIGLAAVGAFAMGVINAPQRGGRLPGEKAPGVAGPAAPIEAPDATPLSNERIEGPPPPTPEEIAKAKAEEEAKKAAAEAAKLKAEEEAAAAAEEAAMGNTPAPPPVLRPSPPPAGNAPGQTLGGPPTPDDPVF